MKRIFIIALVVVSQTACEKKCTIPPGTYQMAMKSIEGSCPPNLVEPFEAMSETIEIEAKRECNRFIAEVSGELNEDCAIESIVSAEANDRGLYDGQSNIKVTCQSGFTCEHVFSVDFTRVPTSKE